MDRAILSIRCGTLEAFLDRVERADSIQERSRLAIDLSGLADKVLAMTPMSEFSAAEYQTLESNLEHIALAVFIENLDWARASLNNVKELTRELF